MDFIDQKKRVLLSVPDSVEELKFPRLDLDVTCANLAEGLLSLRRLRNVYYVLSHDPDWMTAELRAFTRAKHLSGLRMSLPFEHQDITPLAACTFLEFLGFHHAHKLDVTPLAGLLQLKAVMIDGSIKNPKVLGTLTNLRTLTLTSNKNVALKHFAALTNLEDACLVSSKIVDPEGFRAFPHLRYLDIRNTNVTTLSVLDANVKLECLKLNSCRKLASLDGIEKLTALTWLEIDKLRTIPTLQPVAALNALKTLLMADTRAADGSLLPLAGLPSLTMVELTNYYGDHALTVAAAMPWCQFSLIGADRGGQLFEVHGEIQVLRDLEDDPPVFRIDQDLTSILGVDTNHEAEDMVCDDMERAHPTMVADLDFDSEGEAFVVRSTSLEAIRAVAQRINEIVRTTR